MKISELINMSQIGQFPSLASGAIQPAKTSSTSQANANLSAAASEQVSSESTRTEQEFTTFLSLLTAQVRNQDPLAPLDSTQFVDQLASFSSLELQATANQVLTDIATLLAQALYDVDTTA